ncbi:uncharacterized protein K452DRAFT_337241 [Aplosporella prunicola CBS 121167]|uniref:Uncharacterized protein n=1 Tax=Aplosporella prunicola CBS 121167 TaxID=1176127 RepID=A0A6A6BUM6_9PEZI|nr:uncharacterized protein K452DRAFT_337241 [Aplosporella prunicola CBS 121167]KAF2146924.1 hypothetical protein K452DRAFT_337241 [Aplosporella prunicola CBS 121167]
MTSILPNLVTELERLSLGRDKDAPRRDFENTIEDPVGFSSFYLKERPPTTISTDEFVNECLNPKLDQTHQELLIEENHEYFAKAQRFCDRWNLPEQNSDNFKRLLRGNLLFPVLLLINPCNFHDEDYDQMLEHSPTLDWLSWFFTSIGLSLDDIVIIDIIPLLSKAKRNTMTFEELSKAIPEAFDLAIEFLDIFKPNAIISCQCLTKGQLDETWGRFDHPIARDLCSSVDGACRLEVRRLTIRSRQVHVVKGFHPCYFLREPDASISDQREDLLCQVLRKSYQPCADWKLRIKKDMARQQLTEASNRVKEGLIAFFDILRPYKEAKEEAAGYGISLDEDDLAEDPDVELLVRQLVEFL